MSFFSMASLVIAMAAVVGMFVYIPHLSEFAFWVLVVAYLVWEIDRDHNSKARFRIWLMLSTSILVLAIVGVFADIPIISAYAFWILVVAYLILVGSTRTMKERK